jgi:hypothetical protein
MLSVRKLSTRFQKSGHVFAASDRLTGGRRLRVNAGLREDQRDEQYSSTHPASPPSSLILSQESSFFCAHNAFAVRFFSTHNAFAVRFARYTLAAANRGACSSSVSSNEKSGSGKSL